MSKTNKTRPVRVQMARGDRWYEAVHSKECEQDVKNCNLPPKPSPKHPTSNRPTITKLWESRFKPGKYWISKVECYWSPGPYVGVHRKVKSDCGCRFCTSQDYRKHENRRNRHTTKQRIQKELRDE